MVGNERAVHYDSDNAENDVGHVKYPVTERAILRSLQKMSERNHGEDAERGREYEVNDVSTHPTVVILLYHRLTDMSGEALGQALCSEITIFTRSKARLHGDTWA